MRRPKFHWLIGINPKTKGVEIKLSDPKNPDQVKHLICVDTYHGFKIPKSVVKLKHNTLEAIRDLI